MPELPQGVERYELAIELGRTGFKDRPVAEPSLDGDWIKVSALPQLHKTWAEGLLSEEVVEAVLRLSEQREASELRSEKMPVEELSDAQRGPRGGGACGVRSGNPPKPLSRPRQGRGIPSTTTTPMGHPKSA